MRPRWLACGFASVLGVTLGLGCVTAMPEPEESYRYFAAVTPEDSPWYGKVEAWQKRAQAEAGVPVAQSSSSPDRPSPESDLLGDKIVLYRAEQRRSLAERM